MASTLEMSNNDAKILSLGDVDVAREFHVDYLSSRHRAISKPVRARSKNYREPFYD